LKIRLLTSAFNDLAAGRDFYERQGTGGYFLDSLFSDIDSLVLYAGIHRKGFWISSNAGEALSLRHLLSG